MKKIIILLCVLLVVIFTSQPYAESANKTQISAELSWTPNSEPDLVGYKVYRSKISGNHVVGAFLKKISCAPNNTNCSRFIDFAARGKTFYYVVSAFDSNGNESVFSKEVVATY